MFSTKSGLSLVRAESIQCFRNKIIWKQKPIWKLKIIPKIKTFLWRILQGGTPTKERLASRGWHGLISCDLCPKEKETDFHVFFGCPLAAEVWEIIGHALGLSLSPSMIEKLFLEPSSISQPRYWWFSTVAATTLLFI